MIAAKLAAQGEVELERLLLLAPAGLGKEINADFVDGMIAADNIADLEREITKLDGGALSATYLAELLSRIQSRRPMLRDLAASITDEDGQRHSIISDLERVKVPIAAIFGLKDRIIPWQHAAQLPARVAVHFVKTAGHMPHWAAPNLVADLLLGRS
jgi:pimeloyl-ACP methyl ester carboxylesterase